MRTLVIAAALLGCQPSNDSSGNKQDAKESPTSDKPGKVESVDPAPKSSPANGQVKAWLTGDLPKCSKAFEESILYYVVSESTFKYCVNGEWKPIDLRGPKGDQGIKGDRGDQGVAGPTGAQGLQGLPGANGQTGPQGAQGLPGLNGAVGPQGPQGLVGATGIQGPQGLVGQTGATGPQGLRGQDGLDGDKYVGGILHSSDGTTIGTIVDDFDFNTTDLSTLYSSYNSGPVWVEPNSQRLFIVKSASNKFYGFLSDSPSKSYNVPNMTNTSADDRGKFTYIRSRTLERHSLTKLSMTASVLAYTNPSCSGDGGVLFYSNNAYTNPGNVNRALSNVNINFFSELNYPLLFNWLGSLDILPECQTTTFITDIQSLKINGVCMMTTSGSKGFVCPYTISTPTVPNQIASGWYVTR